MGRSLSDEEKSASLKRLEKEDDYSAMFETALEDTDDQNLQKSYTLNTLEFTQARSKFIQSQVESSTDSDSGNEEKPPDPPEEETGELRAVQDSDNSGNVDNDSGFPTKKQSPSSVSDSGNTKETLESDTSTSSISLVKLRMRLFEEGKRHEEEDQTSIKKVDSSVDDHAEIQSSLVEHSTDASSAFEASHITITDTSNESEDANASSTSPSVVIITDGSGETAETSKQSENENEYPDDLNPFGEEEEQQQNSPSSVPSTSKEDYNRSFNPFESGDDEEEEFKKPSAKPRIKKKIKPLDESALNVAIHRESYNPFEEDEDDEEESKADGGEKKLVVAPRISLTPYWKDHKDDNSKEKPVPLPRSSM